MSRTRLLLTILITLAADVGSAGSKAESCGEDVEMTFEGWRKWVQITPKPVVSMGHSNNWVGIYVDERAKDTYLSAGSPYPECARIVKPIYNDGTGESVRKLTVMVKMSPGYDPENGDWWYATYDADGGRAWKQGRLGDCISCHKHAAETDYLFSKDVLDQAKE